MQNFTCCTQRSESLIRVSDTFFFWNLRTKKLRFRTLICDTEILHPLKSPTCLKRSTKRVTSWNKRKNYRVLQQRQGAEAPFGGHHTIALTRTRVTVKGIKTVKMNSKELRKVGMKLEHLCAACLVCMYSLGRRLLQTEMRHVSNKSSCFGGRGLGCVQFGHNTRTCSNMPVPNYERVARRECFLKLRRW